MLLPNVKEALKNFVCIVLGVICYSPFGFAQNQLALDNNALTSSQQKQIPRPSPAIPANQVIKDKKSIDSAPIDAEKIVVVSKTAPLNIDINTLPLYGEFEKTPAQKVIDELFIKDCKKEFASQKEAAQFFSKMAWQYLEEGDKATALSRFNYAWLLDQEQTESYWGLGVLEYQAGNMSNAVSLLKRGLAISDKNYIMMVDLATVYLKMAIQNQNSLFEINEAKTYINKAIEIQPSYTNAYWQLSTLYLIDNQLDMSWEAFHKAFQMSPTEVNQELLQELLNKQADPKGIFKKN
jgi:tetratricopeptide (TPR) repeat protein